MTDPVQKINVLFVDDEENILKSLTRLFMDEPFGVATTTDHQTALQIVEREDIKVIVSDQRMPKMSGVELLSKAKLIKPHTVRILFTGYADIQATQDAINQGEVYRYISKPWDDEGLKATVRDAIRNFDLARENRALFELTQKQNDELKRANEDVRRLFEKEKAFSSTVSHELRTPLTVIKMALEMVRVQSGPSANPEAVKYLGVAGKNVDRLSRLVNDILGLTKLQSGAEELERKPEDINRIIREVADVQELAAKAKGIAFVLKLDAGLPATEANADKLHQVLNNLFHNAIKFTDKGSITVESRRSSEAGSIEVEVRDTGRGMRAEDLPKIFERFSQLGEAHERVSGTGLGLAICKEIVERHGGRLWAESEPGRGSSFIFTLPVSVTAGKA